MLTSPHRNLPSPTTALGLLVKRVRNNVIGICLLAFSTIAHAQDARDLVINGPADGRVDIAILGDGFTVAERDAFFIAAESTANAVLAEPPFSNYQGHFNVRLVFTPSNESGADDPSENIYRDTVFGAAFDCYNIARLICVNTSAVATELASRLGPDEHDIVIVLVNDEQYGGSGGTYAVASLNASADEIAIHELGHSFGRLADEYEADQANCDFYASWRSAPNIAETTTRELIKWNVGGGPPTGWIDPARPLPSTDQTASLPGLYDGGSLCPKGVGVYRPTLNSKMRSLGQPFDAINSEQLILKVYQGSGLLQGINHGASTVLALAADELPFTPPLVGSSSQLGFSWRRGGSEFSTEASLSTGDLTQAVNVIAYRIEDASGVIRNDPSALSVTEGAFYIASGDTTEAEPNDTVGLSAVLAAGVTTTGTINATGEDTVDIFQLATPLEGNVTLQVAGLGPDVTDTQLRIRDASGSWSQDYPVDSGTLTSAVDGTLNGPGVYTVEIIGTQPAAYALRVDYPTASTEVSPPSVTIVEASFGSITLRIQPAASDDFELTQYTVECTDGSTIRRAESSEALVTLEGLDEASAYTCSVRVANAFGVSATAALPDALTPSSDTPGLPVWLLGEILKRRQ